MLIFKKLNKYGESRCKAKECREVARDQKQKVEVLASMPSYKMLLDHPGIEKLTELTLLRYQPALSNSDFFKPGF